jgi:prepilin-type N-terminal cleavage/methylation domain-containing protein
MKRQPQQNLSQSRDGGYTIIESLVAMIVVSVLMIAIAPVMAFSVATRVQARRVELATQAARAYIDALRTGAIKSTETGRFPSSDDTPTTANTLCIDGGCDASTNKGFLVQGVLQAPPTPLPTDLATTGYSLTVRVYRADAFTAGTGEIKTTQQSVANSGLGNPKAPLVVMKTEIPASTVPGSYGSLCLRLPDRTGATNPNACK